jgi:GGDEF domain-containing protein
VSHSPLERVLAEVFDRAVVGEFWRAGALAEKGLAQLRAKGLDVGQQLPAAAALMAALDDLLHGRYESSLAALREPLAVVAAGPHGADLSFIYSCIGFALGKLGDAQSGLAWVARAVALAKASGRSLELLKAVSDEGCLHGMLNHDERAIARLTEASTLAQKSAPRTAQIACFNNLAYAYLMHASGLMAQGATGKAHAAAERAEAWIGRALQANVSRPAHGPSSAWSRATRARARLLLGRTDEAEADLSDALDHTGGYMQVHVEVLRAWMALHRQRGAFDRARACLHEALALCADEGYEPLKLFLFEDALLLEAAAARPAEALAWWLRHFAARQAQVQRRQQLEDKAGPLFGSQGPAFWPDPRARREDAVDGWLDPATGLLNQGGLEEVAQAAFAQPGGLAVALVTIDGTVAGADTVRHVAHQLAALWQRGYVAARTLGDKFVLLFPEVPEAVALALCRELQADLARPAAGHAGQPGPEAGAPVSIGFAARHRHADLAALMTDAARALERAIAQGGNRLERADLL